MHFDQLYQTDILTAIQWSVAVILAITFLLFLMTLIKRTYRIRKDKIKQQYQQIADEVLFGLMFLEKTMDESLQLYHQKKNQSGLFHKIMIKSILALHKNYTGTQKQILEQFYHQSGLVNYSLKRLRDSNYEHIIEGIRDLSRLQYHPCYDEIFARLLHKNDRVQKEACIGIVALQGIEGLKKLTFLDVYLDDWTQANILYVLKLLQKTPNEGLSDLLNGKNESFLLLVARIIHYFKIPGYIPRLDAIISNTSNHTILHQLLLIQNGLKQEGL